VSKSVELRNVWKSYGADTPVLRDVSLRVMPGERLCLLGPSGSGKTTTLNVIAGFTKPDRGSVLIGGVPQEGIAPHKRRVGVVFQSYALFPHMTVYENVAFGLKMHKYPAADIPARVRECLQLVRLTDVEKRYPAQLSGGQQQRVALARALAMQPDVLLLDEPLSNLDAKLRREMRAELLDLHSRTQVTMIFVTHDQEEALTLGHRIAVLRDGQLQQVGTPDELYNTPSNLFVADFIGESNLLPGRVTRHEGGVATVQGNGFLCDARAMGLCQPGDTVTVAIRPHNLTFVSSRDKALGEGRVLRVTYMGGRTEYEVAVGPHVVLVWLAADERPAHAVPMEPGSVVYLAPRDAAKVLCYPETKATT